VFESHRARTAAHRPSAQFVEEYLVDLKGKWPAIRAGYHPKNARSQASRLSTKANFKRRSRRRYKERQARTQLTADSTVRAIALLADSDSVIYDDHGNLPDASCPTTWLRALASIEVVSGTSRAGRQAGICLQKSDRKRCSSAPLLTSCSGRRGPRAFHLDVLLVGAAFAFRSSRCG